MYTVVAGKTTCTDDAPQPLQALAATANYTQGYELVERIVRALTMPHSLLSTYGWPDQCTGTTKPLPLMRGSSLSNRYHRRAAGWEAAVHLQRLAGASSFVCVLHRLSRTESNALS